MAMGRVLEAFAWASLLAAFIIGQIAAQTDYEGLLKKQFPDARLIASGNANQLPVVYRVEIDGKASPDVIIMSEGIGYGGPLVVGIKARRTDEGAKVNEIRMLSHKETPSFMEQLNSKHFFRQFAGKNITDNFIVDDDIDAVTGATVSSKAFTAAVREAVHLGATQDLKLQAVWQTPAWKIGINEIILVSLFALAFFGAYRRDKLARHARTLVMVGSLVFVGFYANLSLNLGNLAGIFMGYIPSLKQQPLWWIMMAGALGSVVIVGRNIYCHQICPFKVVQDLLQKISGIKLRIKPELQRKSRALILFLSWIAVMLIFLSTHPALGSYEPFAMMFSLEGMGIQWYIMPAAVLGSLFVPSFWCRLFCPVGLYLNQVVRMRRAIRKRFFKGGGKPPSGSTKTATAVKTIKVKQV